LSCRLCNHWCVIQASLSYDIHTLLSLFHLESCLILQYLWHGFCSKRWRKNPAIVVYGQLKRSYICTNVSSLRYSPVLCAYCNGFVFQSHPCMSYLKFLVLVYVLIIACMCQTYDHSVVFCFWHCGNIFKFWFLFNNLPIPSARCSNIVLFLYHLILLR
jgi:hypothetical protein